MKLRNKKSGVQELRDMLSSLSRALSTPRYNPTITRRKRRKSGIFSW